jgi:low-affinity ferrous iron transport protein
VFLGTLALLLVWTILGIALGATDVWQIVMQNASSIQCYVSDTLLMRQQVNTTHSFFISIAEMRSRSASCLRIVRSLWPFQLQELKDLQTSKFKKSSSLLTRDQKRKEWKANLFDRACDAVTLATGSLPALTIYFIRVFVWLGLGSLFKMGQHLAALHQHCRRRGTNIHLHVSAKRTAAALWLSFSHFILDPNSRLISRA